MTITSPISRRPARPLALAALLACLAPAAAMAWQQQPAPQPNYNAIQAQQANQQAILNSKLQTNQLLEQQRQRNAAAIRQPMANNPAAANALDQANQAQLDRFNARQRDAVDQYRAASSAAPLVLPQPVPAASAPKKNAHPPPRQSTQNPPQQ